MFNTNPKWHRIFAIFPRPLGTFNPNTYKREGPDAGKSVYFCVIERRYTGWLTGNDGTPIQEYRKC